MSPIVFSGLMAILAVAGLAVMLAGIAVMRRRLPNVDETAVALVLVVLLVGAAMFSWAPRPRMITPVQAPATYGATP